MIINESAWTGPFFEEFLFTKDKESRRLELITLLEKHRFKIYYPGGKNVPTWFTAANFKFDRSGNDLHIIKKNGTVTPKKR